MRSIVSCLLLISLTACTQPANKDAEAVREVATGIIAADNRADIEKVLYYYSFDAVLAPPARPLIVGEENIRKNYENIFANSTLTLESSIDDLIVEGTVAVCSGRTFGSVTMKLDSSIREVNDKYVMILRKENTNWKITRLIWN